MRCRASASPIRTEYRMCGRASAATISFKAAKAEFEHMMRLGIVEPSDSEFASRLHMVPKNDGSLTLVWR